MPKILKNNEEVVKLYREFLKLVDPYDANITRDLEGEELKDFYKYCHETFHNPFFGKIINGFIMEQCLKTANQGLTPEQQTNGKLSINGIMTLENFFARAANEYDKLTAKGEEFDPQKAFNPAKI
jgi:hypothetical protein